MCSQQSPLHSLRYVRSDHCSHIPKFFPGRDDDLKRPRLLCVSRTAIARHYIYVTCFNFDARVGFFRACARASIGKESALKIACFVRFEIIFALALRDSCSYDDFSTHAIFSRVDSFGCARSPKPECQGAFLFNPCAESDPHRVTTRRHSRHAGRLLVSPFPICTLSQHFNLLLAATLSFIQTLDTFIFKHVHFLFRHGSPEINVV